MIRRLRSALLTTACIFFSLGGYAAGAHKQIVDSYVVPPGRMAGNVPADTIIHLAIGLPPRDAAGLSALADEVSDPKSENYHRFLTLDQVTERFGPSVQDYQTLIAWARSNRLHVVAEYPHRLLLGVDGKAADVARAFGIKLGYAMRPDGSRFYKPNRAPSLGLGVKVSHIAGVDNFFVPRRHGGSQTVGGGFAYASVDLRNAYADSCQGLTGAGESVGIMAYGGYNHSDVAAYETAAGLPSQGTCGLSTSASPPCLTDVLLGGFTGPINAYSTEATADVESAIAMAPGLHQVKVFAADPLVSGCTSGDSIVSAMVAATDVKQFSSSVSFCVSDNIALFDTMANTGKSFFVPSGDYGTGFSTNGPSSSANFNMFMQAKVTVVGGTVLAMTGPGTSYASEQAWKFSGGGVEDFPNYSPTCPANCTPGASGCPNTCIPAWQQGIANAQNGASTTYRNEPDVALPAQTVFIVYNNGAHATFCGTSGSAPAWAGYMALVNEQKCRNSPSNCAQGHGFVNPALYDIGRNPATYGTSFHDITSNSSDATTCSMLSGQSATAVPGYDLATGWGTPKCGIVDQLTCTTCSGTTATPGTPPSASCVAFQSDSNNCGSCGNMCQSNAACVSGQCQVGGSHGDTHIVTIDGLFYDFQAYGDFLLATTGADFIVQTRQVALPRWPDVAVNKAVAMQMGKTRVAIFLDPLRVVIDGRPTLIDDGKKLSLPDNVDLARTANIFTIKHGGGETVRVDTYGTWMDVWVALGYSPHGRLHGLLGNGNGSTHDDIATRDGVALIQPVSFEDLYHRYADDLRVRPGESLFGEESRGEPGIPAKPFYAGYLPRQRQGTARALCKAEGVTHAALLDACVLDVTVLDSAAAAKVFAVMHAPTAVMQAGSHHRHPKDDCDGKCGDDD
jgi:hypothetical protein